VNVRLRGWFERKKAKGEKLHAQNARTRRGLTNFTSVGHMPKPAVHNGDTTSRFRAQMAPRAQRRALPVHFDPAQCGRPHAAAIFFLRLMFQLEGGSDVAE